MDCHLLSLSLFDRHQNKLREDYGLLWKKRSKSYGHVLMIGRWTMHISERVTKTCLKKD